MSLESRRLFSPEHTPEHTEEQGETPEPVASPGTLSGHEVSSESAIGIKEPSEGQAETIVTPEERELNPEELEAAEGVRQGILASLKSRFWKQVPGAEAAIEDFEEPAEVSEGETSDTPKEHSKAIQFFKKVMGKQVWGRSVGTLLAGAVGGSAASRLTRLGLGVLTGGAGYGVAMAGGAASGAVVEGIKVYASERKREVAHNEFVERAVRQGKQEMLQDRLDRYLELTQEETPGEFTPEKQELYRELRKELGGVRGKEIMKGCLKGAAIGAVGGLIGEGLMNWLGVKEAFAQAPGTGGAGAAVKGEASRALQEKMAAVGREAHAKAYEKAIEAGAEALKQKDFAAIVEKGQGGTHIARKLIADYIGQNGHLTGGVGMGRAQLVYAEDLMRKTLLGKEHALQIGERFTLKGQQILDVLSKANELSKEQVDNLNKKWVGKISQKTWERVLDYSHPFTAENNFAGTIIKQANEYATTVADSEVARFAQQAAQEVAPQAVQTGAEQLGQQAGGAAKAVGHIATEAAKPIIEKSGEQTGFIEAAQNWLHSRTARIAMGAGLALGGGLVAYQIVKRRASRRGDGKVAGALGTGEPEVIDLERGVDSTDFVPPPSGPAAEPAFAEPEATAQETGEPTAAPERPRSIREPQPPRRGVRARIGEALGRYRGRWRARGEQRRAAAEPELINPEQRLQQQLAEYGIPEDLRSSSLEEEQRKLSADPLNKFLREQGIISTDEDRMWFRSPNVDDLGKTEGIRVMYFRSYTDYRAYLEGMTPAQRRWAKEIVTIQGNSRQNTLGVTRYPRVGERIDALEPEQRRLVDDLIENAITGVLADEFRNRPKVNFTTIRGLCSQFNERFPWGEYMMKMEYYSADNPNFSELEIYNGTERLINVLTGFFRSSPPSLDFSNTVIGVGEGGTHLWPYATSGYSFQVQIEVDPSLSEDEMREYLIGAVEEAKRLKESLPSPPSSE